MHSRDFQFSIVTAAFSFCLIPYALAQQPCGGIQGLICDGDNEFCKFEIGTCNIVDNLGVCETFPEGCPDVFDPVCGCDGVTYGNACEADMAGVSLDHEGACEGGAECGDGFCSDAEDCENCPEDCGPCGEKCGGFPGFPCDDGEFCMTNPGECCCDFFGTCHPIPDDCPDVHDPVCGCDGETYSNACFAAMVGVSIDHEGECEGGPECGDGFCSDAEDCENCPEDCGPCGEKCGGLPGFPCDDDEYCQLPTGKCCCDFFGICQPIPDFCPEVHDPVCGCDGETYTNACFAAMAGVSIDHEGKCEGGQDCPDAPILGAAPPAGTIDARQPHLLGHPLELQGIGGFAEPILIELGVSGAVTECFSLCETDDHPELGPNSVHWVVDNGDGTYVVMLDRPITTNAATVISYAGAGGAGVLYTAHPANVNADGIAGAGDVLALIDILNDQSEPVHGEYSTDIDHSGATGGPDVLRTIDLLNGSEGFPVQNLSPLPDASECLPGENVCGGIGGIPCDNDDEFCKFEIGTCDVVDNLGMCVMFPLGCPDNVDPVCGCDGVTYFNACEADMAGVSLDHEGECEDEPEICGGIGGIPCDNDDEFCKFEIGTCNIVDNLGVCETFPEACPDVFDPVCGCDGVTYGNACEADMAGVSLDHEGECEGEPDCGDGFCGDAENCETCPEDCGPCGEKCGGFLGLPCNDGEYCQLPTGKCCCDFFGTCQVIPDSCPDVFDPVCGCDGQTYTNECFAAMAGISLEHDGACEGEPDCGDGFCGDAENCETCPEDCGPCGGEPCGGFLGLICEDPGTFCKLDIPGCCCDLPGTCTPFPNSCPDVFDPVCGCDGKTYTNECFADAAGVSVDHEGPCN